MSISANYSGVNTAAEYSLKSHKQVLFFSFLALQLSQKFQISHTAVTLCSEGVQFGGRDCNHPHAYHRFSVVDMLLHLNSDEKIITKDKTGKYESQINPCFNENLDIFVGLFFL